MPRIRSDGLTKTGHGSVKLFSEYVLMAKKCVGISEGLVYLDGSLKELDRSVVFFLKTEAVTSSTPSLAKWQGTNNFPIQICCLTVNKVNIWVPFELYFVLCWIEHHRRASKWNEWSGDSFHVLTIKQWGVLKDIPKGKFKLYLVRLKIVSPSHFKRQHIEKGFLLDAAYWVERWDTTDTSKISWP